MSVRAGETITVIMDGDEFAFCEKGDEVLTINLLFMFQRGYVPKIFIKIQDTDSFDEDSGSDDEGNHAGRFRLYVFVSIFLK